MNTGTVLATAVLTAAVLATATAEARPDNNRGGGSGGGGGNGGDAPILSFAADQAAYVAGERALLSWASVNTRSCEASGDWSGRRDTEGNFRTQPLEGSASFTLTCYTAGRGNRSVTETLTLEVTSAEPEPVQAPEPIAETEPSPEPEPIAEPEPSPAPSLSFSAVERSVRNGEYATLSWASRDTTDCSASGGWTGSRPVSGTESVGPLVQGTTFSLTCSGPGGNVLEMLTVTVVSPVSISWVAPTANVDGSPLTDLASYRLYLGLRSGEYTTTIPLADASATSHTIELETGSYFLAMTALDGAGNESTHSNEVERTAP